LDRNEFLAYIWDTTDRGGFIAVCAWCGRTRVGEEWVVPPPGALSTVDARIVLSHSICPSCAAAVPGPKPDVDPG
jgi:hypothetical protein